VDREVPVEAAHLERAPRLDLGSREQQAVLAELRARLDQDAERPSEGRKPDGKGEAKNDKDGNGRKK
jgi:hypothetical protein